MQPTVYETTPASALPHESLIGAPLPPVLLSTYFSEACSKGRLFDPRTYDRQSIESFLDHYAFTLTNSIPIPIRFSTESITALFRKSLDGWSEKYTKAVTDTDPEDAKSVGKTIRKARDGGKSGLDHLIQFLRKDEFPQILWMEAKRARQAYFDSLGFMITRMEKWFSYPPRYKSQTRQRSSLTKSMLQPFLSLFQQFSQSTTRFSMMLLFMEVWTCSEEAELFSEKPWSMEGVDRASFDQALWPLIENLHQSISNLREAYFDKAVKTPAELGTGPVASALRQLVTMAEVS